MSLREVRATTWFWSFDSIKNQWFWKKENTRVIKLEHDSVICKQLKTRKSFTKEGDGIKTRYTRLWELMHVAPLAPRREGQKVRGVSIE